MLETILLGLLVNAISATGRILAGPLPRLVRSRRSGDEIDIARWFDTYELTDRGPELPDMSPAAEEELATVLRGDDVQAVLQELLAARLTDAPEADITRIRSVWDLTFARNERALGTAASAVVLFDFYDSKIGELVARLEGSEPQFLQQIRNDAYNTRLLFILNAIERHTAALTTGSDRSSDEEFLRRYRRQVRSQHGKLEPPDFSRRRRVPIADIYVDTPVGPELRSDPDYTLHDRPSEGLSDVRGMAAIIDRSVLLGDPGGGKTTATNVLADQLAGDPAGKVPFLVTLRDYAATHPPERAVVGHIEHTLATFYQCPAPPGAIDRLLLTGRAIVIFDGLDELLDTSRRADVTTRVERFCQEYPLVPVLVTSRLIGYDQARLDDDQFTCYRLGRFGDGEVAEYAHKWFALETDARPGDAEAFLAESVGVPDLRANPLMLSLMCILYRGEGSLPRDRAGVYQQCAELLFRKWDERRRIHRELRAGRLVETALRHLAWWLFTRDEPQPAVTERELVTETTSFLHGRGFESHDEAADAAREFVEFCRDRMWVFTDVGTTASGERLYAFTHRTFLEYFAASRLASVSDTPEDVARALAPRLAVGAWQVVGELAFQLKDHVSDQGADRFCAEILNETRQPSYNAGQLTALLTFVAGCPQSGHLSPANVRHITEAVLDHLFGHSDGWSPLRRLLCNDEQQDLIADEISRCVGARARSDDASVQHDALNLILAIGYYFLMDSSDVASRHSLRASFWWQWSSNQARALVPIIEIAAAHEDWIKASAVEYELILPDQALEMPSGLDVLMHNRPVPLSGMILIALLPEACWSLLDDAKQTLRPELEDPRERLLGLLAALGRYLQRHRCPPWIRDATGGMVGQYEWQLAAEYRSLPLDEVTYLGLAAVILMSAELTEVRLLPPEPPGDGAPPSLLVPYLSRRYGNPSDDIPDLPVPAEFRRLFRDWADGKVSFTQREASHGLGSVNHAPFGTKMTASTAAEGPRPTA
jgi:NACHT domain